MSFFDRRTVKRALQNRKICYLERICIEDKIAVTKLFLSSNNAELIKLALSIDCPLLHGVLSIRYKSLKGSVLDFYLEQATRYPATLPNRLNELFNSTLDGKVITRVINYCYAKHAFDLHSFSQINPTDQLKQAYVALYLRLILNNNHFPYSEKCLYIYIFAAADNYRYLHDILKYSSEHKTKQLFENIKAELMMRLIVIAQQKIYDVEGIAADELNLFRLLREKINPFRLATCRPAFFNSTPTSDSDESNQPIDDVDQYLNLEDPSFELVK